MSGLNTERVVTRAEAAEYLREFADKLDGHTEHAGSSGTTGTATGVTGANTTTGASEQSTTTDTTNASTEARQRGGTGDASDATDETTHDDTQHARTPGKVTFLVGNDSATVHPPDEVTLDVAVGEDSSMMSSGAETVTFSLRWDKEAVPESDELRIE